jgi:hypothetical protein
MVTTRVCVMSVTPRVAIGVEQTRALPQDMDLLQGGPVKPGNRPTVGFRRLSRIRCSRWSAQTRTVETRTRPLHHPLIVSRLRLRLARQCPPGIGGCR